MHRPPTLLPHPPALPCCLPHLILSFISSLLPHQAPRQASLTLLLLHFWHLSQDLVVTTYGTLASDHALGSSAQQGLLSVTWLRVVLDEAHTIKNTGLSWGARQGRRTGGRPVGPAGGAVCVLCARGRAVC